MILVKRNQLGVTTVEFAIVALVALIILFGSLEVARLFFTVNVLEEATRRGARMAAVCTVDSPAIARAAVFNSSGSGTASPILNNLDTGNIAVEYLDENGDALSGYNGDDSIYLQIEYVRVSITNFQYNFLLPGLEFTFVTDGYPTIMPRESLGVAKVGQTSTCV